MALFSSFIVLLLLSFLYIALLLFSLLYLKAITIKLLSCNWERSKEEQKNTLFFFNLSFYQCQNLPKKS